MAFAGWVGWRFGSSRSGLPDALPEAIVRLTFVTKADATSPAVEIKRPAI